MDPRISPIRHFSHRSWNHVLYPNGKLILLHDGSRSGSRPRKPEYWRVRTSRPTFHPIPCIITSHELHNLTPTPTSSLFTLKRKGALKTANITHVLSVLTLPLDDALFEGYQHLAIDVDDVDDADIIQHFSVTNAFIREGLEGGGGVLVHW